MLISDLCNYSDACIVPKGIIYLSAVAANENGKSLKDVAFRECIIKINNTFIANAEDHNIIMATYNLLDYSDNYFTKARSCSNYYRDQVDNVNDNVWQSKSFAWKTKITGKTPEQPPLPPQSLQAPPNSDSSWPPRSPQPLQPRVWNLNVEITSPFKHLINFCRCLDLPN